MQVNYLGKGIYTIQEAARLLRLPRPTVRRWALGYARRGMEYEPAIEISLPPEEGKPALAFLDLVELMYIDAFRRSKISWKKIHHAAKTAARMHDTAHPFALRKFFVEGGKHLHAVLEKSGEEHLVELRGDGQLEMETVLHHYLDQLEFGIDDLAQRWSPIGKRQPIVIDPQIAFGAPVVRNTGIETATLARMHEGGETIDGIAWWYELEEWQVEAAVAFEKGLATAA